MSGVEDILLNMKTEKYTLGNTVAQVGQPHHMMLLIGNMQHL